MTIFAYAGGKCQKNRNDVENDRHCLLLFYLPRGMNREKRLTLKKAMLLNESSQTAKTPSTKRKEKDSDASVLTNFKFFPESAKAP